MKLTLLTLLFSLSVISVGSAQYLSAKDSDPEALRLLSKAGQAFENRNVQVNFKIKMVIPGQKPVMSDGILYQAGKSYHLDLEEYAIISDGKTRWVFLKGPNEVNIYNESNGQDWISPQDFLKLHTSPDLVFALAGTKAEGVSIIEAKPLKGRFEEYSKFTIGIADGSLSLVYAITSDGVRQEMNITSITYPTSWDAKKLFSFQPELYPGVHIEDLRLD